MSGSIVRLPSYRLALVCDSIQTFSNRLKPRDRVIGMSIRKDLLSLSVSDPALDKASAFGIMQRIGLKQDRKVLQEAIRDAKKFEPDFAVGGFVIGDRHRAPDEPPSTESQQMADYVAELLDRRDFPHMGGIIYISELEAAVKAIAGSLDFEDAISTITPRDMNWIDRRAVAWDRGAPRMSPHRVDFEQVRKQFALSARSVLQVALDAIKHERGVAQAPAKAKKETGAARGG